MKKTYRLLALLLALLMVVNISALATEGTGVSMDAFDMAVYNRALQSANQAAKNAEYPCWATLSNAASFNDEASFGSAYGTIPANSLIKVIMYDTSNMVYQVEYNGKIGYISGSFITSKCKCENSSITDPATHSAECVYPQCFINLADEKSAAELYTMWPSFTAAEQAYILSYLEAQIFTKYTQLLALLNPVVEEQTKTETVDGTTVSVTGNIPADVELTLAPVTDSETLDSILPNFNFQHAAYFALDVSLWQNGDVWQPDGDTVRVTITVNENIGKAGDYFALYHKHGNEQPTNLGLYPIANDGTLTFDMSRFSVVLGMNMNLCTADCWIHELGTLPTATARYQYLLEKRKVITEYDVFMLHYRVTHLSSNLVCTCQYDSIVQYLENIFKYVDSIYEPGHSIHTADCPWAFKNLAVEEQADILVDKTEEERAPYLETLTPEQKEALEELLIATEAALLKKALIEKYVDPAVVETWIKEVNPSIEMMQRALRAKSLTNVLLEGDTLYSVYTGKPLAIYNAATGIVKDIASGLEFTIDELPAEEN